MLFIGPKFPSERVPVRIDFKKLLAVGETIQSVDEVSVSVLKGALDNNPGAIIDSDPVLDADTVVTFWLTDGLDKTTYAIAPRVTTSTGATRKGKVALFVSDEI